MNIYHTGSKFSEAKNNDVFGELIFFGSKRGLGLGKDQDVLVVNLDEIKICQTSDLDESPLFESYVKDFAEECEVDYEEAEDCILSSESDTTSFPVQDAGFGLSSGWEAQRIQGILALSLGFDGIELRDESGTSYFISAKKALEIGSWEE